jgi:Flp pilus assembly protein TadG
MESFLAHIDLGREAGWARRMAEAVVLGGEASGGVTRDLSRPSTILRTVAVLRRFGRDRRGATAVEYAFVAIPFLGLLFAILEMAFVFLTGEALDAATQTAARNLMTGSAQQANITTADQFKTTYLCPASGARPLPSFIDCGKLIIDVRTAASFGAANTSNTFYENPSATQFCPGGPQTITIVRVAYPMPVFLPILADLTSATFGQVTAGLVNDIPNDPGWKHLLLGISVFQTEPYATTGVTAGPSC